jgi:hypothetical protein
MPRDHLPFDEVALSVDVGNRDPVLLAGHFVQTPHTSDYKALSRSRRPHQRRAASRDRTHTVGWPPRNLRWGRGRTGVMTAHDLPPAAARLPHRPRRAARGPWPVA